MIVGIMQPYFMPYLGYWQLMKAVDTYVIYDDVNYIKGGWVSRNNILLNEKKYLFTIKLKGASPNKLFNEIFVLDNFKSFSKTIQYAYSKAPYYKQISSLLDMVYAYENKSLGDFIKNSFQIILDYLDIHTKLILSSTIDKNNALKGQNKVLNICEILGADKYYNAIGGIDLYDKNVFNNHGIKLYFLNTNFTTYKQYSEDFVQGLSIIDILMFNSPQQVNAMLDNYELI